MKFTSDPSLLPILVWIPPPIGPISSTSKTTWYDLKFVSKRHIYAMCCACIQYKCIFTRSINYGFDRFETAQLDKFHSNHIHSVKYTFETCRLEYLSSDYWFQILLIGHMQSLKLYAFNIGLINNLQLVNQFMQICVSELLYLLWHWQNRPLFFLSF